MIERVVLSLGFLLVTAAVLATLIRFVTRSQNKFLRYAQYGGGLGVLLVLVATLLAFVFGDGMAFLSGLASAPLQFLSGGLYSSSATKSAQTCINGNCEPYEYCCSSMKDKNDTWKDCRADCGSRLAEKVLGRATGKGCNNKPLPAYCSGTSAAAIGSSACNKDPIQGLITCKCCESQLGGEYWWDCADCTSNPDLFGRKVSNELCASTNTIFCHTNDNIDNNNHNSQNF